MILCVKASSGRSIKLGATAQTRNDLAQMQGSSTFSVEGHEGLFHVKDVYAIPSIDTTFGMFILAFFFSLVATKSMPVSAIASVAVALFTKIYFVLDKRAVKHFNESNSYY